MDIIYLPDTEKIIDAYKKICEEFIKMFKYISVSVENFPVTGIHLIYVLVCLEPESICYGKAIGAFIYKDGRVFQFHYNIHTPHAKGPHRSNTMSSIEEIIWTVYKDIGRIEYVETQFGNMAFYDHTPMNSLDEESKTLRTLIKSLQTYCRKENYCKILRKLDDKHEKMTNFKRR